MKSNQSKATQKIIRDAGREGDLIILNGYNLHFQIPPYWVNWFEQNKEKPNIHLTEAELNKVKTATGEWDEVFARVVNFTLPFEHCISHVGREGWGIHGIAYTDLQLRTYIFNNTLEEVEKQVMEKGTLVIENISGKPFAPGIEKTDDWTRVNLHLPCTYGDYRAEAIIDIRFKQINDFIFLFAFMYTDHKDLKEEIELVANSLSFHKD